MAKWWRSGGEDLHSLNVTGFGETSMLNEEGYMCCLGQFAKQKGVSDMDLMYVSCPSTTYNSDNYDTNFVRNERNTRLAKKLMNINDNKELSSWERVNRIREELEKKGHTLGIINHQALRR